MRLGAILGRFRAILDRLGRIWEGFGRVLEAVWEHFWKIFCYLEQKVKIVKNPGKPRFFIDFSGSGRVLGLGKSFKINKNTL